MNLKIKMTSKYKTNKTEEDLKQEDDPKNYISRHCVMSQVGNPLTMLGQGCG